MAERNTTGMFQTGHTSSNRSIATPTRFTQNNYLYVQEVGSLRSLSPHLSSREKLDSYLFMIVLSGEGTVNYLGQDHAMSFGSCAFIDCKKKYSHLSSADRPWELMWVHFNGKSAAALYEQFIRKNPAGIFRCVSVFPYKRALEEMLTLHKERNSLREILSNKHITDIVTQCMLDSPEEMQESDNSIKGKLPLIKAYLDERFAGKILLEDLEEEFYVSRYHLSREFKKAYGTTIGAYVLSLRIGYAKELLRFTNKSIEEITDECGIYDSSYFTKIFRRSEGMTALEYRRSWGTIQNK